jgi:hypothetical protein
MLTEGQYTKRKNPDVRVVARSLGAAPAGRVYYKDEAGRRSAANLMTKDEARRIAANIAKLAGAAAGVLDRTSRTN